MRFPWNRFAIGRLMTSFSAFRVRGKMKCSDESPKGYFEAFVDARKYIPSSVPYKDTGAFILKALEYYHRHLERMRDDAR